MPLASRSNSQRPPGLPLNIFDGIQSGPSGPCGEHSSHKVSGCPLGSERDLGANFSHCHLWTMTGIPANLRRPAVGGFLG